MSEKDEEQRKKEIKRITDSITYAIKIADLTNNGHLVDDERMLYINNDFRCYLKYLDNVPQYNDKKDLIVNIMIDYAKLISMYDEIAKILKKAHANYCVVKSLDPRKLDKGRKEVLKQKDKEITGEYSTSLIETLKYTKQILDRYNVIPEQLRREKNSLINYGISFLVPQTEKEISSIIENEFSSDRIKHNSEVELLTKTIFWINKLIKQINANQTALMLSESKDLELNEGLINDVSDKSKFLAIKRTDIIKKIFELFRQYHPSLKEGLSITEFLTYYDSSKSETNYEDRLELNQTDTIAEEELRRRVKVGKNTDSEFIKFFKKIEKEYNRVFAEQSKNGFVDDCIINNNQTILINKLYKFKDLLIAQLLYALAEDKKLPSKKYANWGIIDDPSGRARFEKSKILIFDLPGYIKPLQVHLPPNADGLKYFEKDKMPEYKGAFGSYKIPTSALFKPSEENKAKIKNMAKQYRVTKNKDKTAKVIQHMSAIINDQYQYIPDVSKESLSKDK